MTEDGYTGDEAATRAGAPAGGAAVLETTHHEAPSPPPVPDEWNETRRDYPRDSCIHHLFEAQVARTPDAIALVHDGGHLSYGELNAAANRVARLLRDGGAGPGRFVALCAEHSPDAVVGLLGILKSGAAYVPIDPAWPAERRRHILASLDVGAVVTRSTQYRRLFDLQWELPQLSAVVCLDVDGDELEAEPVDEDSVRALWDLLTAESTDAVSAAGFRRTEDGSPFTPAEVDQYRDHVVGLATDLADGRSRVLEIGCGSGLVLRSLAPAVREYVGVDPSEQAQAANRTWAAGCTAPVTLVTGFAHDSPALDEGPYDLVVAASTVQFFPGPAYLRRVLRRAAASCAPGGHILLADLVDPLAVEHRFGAAVSRAKRATELHLRPGQLQELVAGIDEIVDVEILSRRGFDNELSCRYDAVLTVGRSGAGPGRPRNRRLRTGADLAALPETDLTGGARPGDLAYAIFTSGSTGVPKGVMVQHRPVANLIDWVNTTFDVGPGDRLLLVTSFCFDLSVYDVFGILAAGGSVRVVDDADLAEPRRLLSLLCTDGITFWDSAPAALHQVMQFADRERPGLPADALRLVFLSGDWVPLALPDHVREHFRGATVVALGGATEATIWSNYFVVDEVDPAWPSIPYGRPIQNARYHVLGDDLSPLPVGEAGDLYIGGECLALGYAGDPDLTAAKFVPDPLCADPGARLYRTGDRARWWPDGNMEFLGRVDSQVKVRGYRVELGEIEVALARHPDVEVAVVVAQPGPAGELQLDAYVILGAGTGVDAAALRSHLAALLPGYMVPQTFTTLPELPLSPTGKVDRRGLPTPGTRGRGQPAEPADELEAMLVALWSDVLGIDGVGVNDNFFDLGGQSLAAARVVARLAELRPVALPLRAVFDHPTVLALAAAVRASLGGAGSRPIEAVADRSAVPLSFLQDQMWEMERNMAPGAWNESFHHRLADPLDIDALSRALAHLVRRHDGLRTVFAVHDGAPTQRVLADATLELTPVDLSATAPEQHDDELARIMAADNEVPFDPGAAPLVRALLVTFGGGRSELVLTFDHLIVDRTSVDILLSDLDDAYVCLARGEAPPPAAPGAHYADFAAWERSSVTADRIEERRRHWSQRLAGIPLDMDLPFDRVPERRGGATSYVAFVVPTHVHASLKRLAVVSKSSLFVISLAAVKVLLHRRTGQTDMVVGTQVSARDRPEVEGTVGLFTGPALLRTDLAGDPTFETVVRRAREGVQELFDHQPFPYSWLLQRLAPEVRRRGIPPWRAIDPVDVEFFYTHPKRWSPGINIVGRPPEGRYPTPEDPAEYSQPLEFTMFTDGSQLWGKLTYPVDLFDVATVEGLVAEFEHILASAAGYWSVRLSALPPPPPRVGGDAR